MHKCRDLLKLIKKDSPLQKPLPKTDLHGGIGERFNIKMRRKNNLRFIEIFDNLKPNMSSYLVCLLPSFINKINEMKDFLEYPKKYFHLCSMSNACQPPLILITHCC